MINHLILLTEEQDLHVTDGKLISGHRKIAIDTLGSIQCFSASCRWSQTALELLVSQCPVIMSRWDKQQKKWKTFSLAPRARYVNPTVLWKLCRLSPQRATQLASGLLWTKVCNQHEMLRSFDPRLAEKPQLRENSFNRILRLEASYARFFWPRYFAALSTDLFEREKRKATHPINAALNYGYGFLYHALEWQCLASGLDPTVGIIHKLRRSRPSLACDLIEPLRCTVELTVVRHLDGQRDSRRYSAAADGRIHLGGANHHNRVRGKLTKNCRIKGVRESVVSRTRSLKASSAPRIPNCSGGSEIKTDKVLETLRAKKYQIAPGGRQNKKNSGKLKTEMGKQRKQQFAFGHGGGHSKPARCR